MPVSKVQTVFRENSTQDQVCIRGEGGLCNHSRVTSPHYVCGMNAPSIVQVIPLLSLLHFWPSGGKLERGGGGGGGGGHCIDCNYHGSEILSCAREDPLQSENIKHVGVFSKCIW